MTDDFTHDDVSTDEPDAAINDGGGLEIADPNDFFHRRDSDDQLQPVVQKIPGRDQALRVVPPTTGDIRKYHLDAEELLYADDELYAEFLNEHFPDLDHVTAEDVEDGMLMFAAEIFVDVAKRAGGQDMKDALDRRQTEEMFDLLGVEEGNVDLQELLALGQANAEEDD